MTAFRLNDRALSLKEMFDNISARYDLMNCLITFGQVWSWRGYLVDMAALPPGGRLLDVGIGTGGIAREALRRDTGLKVTGVDLALRMMQVGRNYPGGGRISWCRSDALRLPFPDATFDAATSGYLIRNVGSVLEAFKEQMRVVRPGGRVVCLETTPPARSLLRPLVLLYLKVVIPSLGQFIARNRAAYSYLPESTRAFMAPDELAATMRSAGLEQVSYRRFMAGTQVVLAGVSTER
jgi:demethylmenaquinone methyltransferase/2-methoxy-6-polyprenyl-1,4-benzoquinol methylase